MLKQLLLTGCLRCSTQNSFTYFLFPFLLNLFLTCIQQFQCLCHHIIISCSRSGNETHVQGSWEEGLVPYSEDVEDGFFALVQSINQKL